MEALIKATRGKPGKLCLRFLNNINRHLTARALLHDFVVQNEACAGLHVTKF